jgi:hypothetical protein
MAPVLKKLRCREGMRIAVLGAPAGLEAALANEAGVERVNGLGKNLDLVLAFFTRKAHVVRDMRRLRDALAPKGMLWLGYPKAKALDTDLNRDILRETVAKVGLEAVAIVALDPVWSALRCKTVGDGGTR